MSFHLRAADSRRWTLLDQLRSWPVNRTFESVMERRMFDIFGNHWLLEVKTSLKSFRGKTSSKLFSQTLLQPLGKLQVNNYYTTSKTI